MPVSESKSKTSNSVLVYSADVKKQQQQQCTLDDVYNEWNKLIMNILVNGAISFDPMIHIAEQFRSGVAANVVVNMDTYKRIVECMKNLRRAVDIRIMRNFWPMFLQIFLHVEDFNSAIIHFYEQTELWERGTIMHKQNELHATFPNYKDELINASRFIDNGEIQFIDQEYIKNCKRLSFYLMLQEKRDTSIKDLIMKVMSRTNPHAIDNLIKFFHTSPALIQHLIPCANSNSYRDKEPLAVDLIRQIYHNELYGMEKQMKRQCLDKIINGLCSECIFVEKREKFEFPVHVDRELFNRALFDDVFEFNPYGRNF